MFALAYIGIYLWAFYLVLWTWGCIGLGDQEIVHDIYKGNVNMQTEVLQL